MADCESADFKMGGRDAPSRRHFSNTSIGSFALQHEGKLQIRFAGRANPKYQPVTKHLTPLLNLGSRQWSIPPLNKSGASAHDRWVKPPRIVYRLSRALE